MGTQQPADLLYDSIRSKLGDHPSLEAAEKQTYVAAARLGIPDNVVAQVLVRFREELTQKGVPSEQPPRLLLDWGELPRVGCQACPTFSLVCPGEHREPRVQVTVDRGLDHDPHDPQRCLRWEADGVWMFHVPFRLTHQGTPCLPGQYLIDVAVMLHSTKNSPPRFYSTHIRLTIPEHTAEGQRVLEIQGDGQSVVNLHGHNLASLSKIILKGDNRAIINIQNLGLSPAEQGEAETPPGSVAYEYELKVNRRLQHPLPVVRTAGELRRHDALTLRLESGRLVHLFARKRLTFGRSRDNSVTIRFLPRSEEHDQLSRSISRTHMIIEFVDEGLLIRDRSSTGIEINDEVVRDEQLLTVRDVGFGLQVSFSGGLVAGQRFEMELALFGAQAANKHLRHEQLEWDKICYELLGERPGRLWQTASCNGIDAARFRRLNNAEDLEEYVALYREVLIGSSRSEDGITLCQRDHGRNVGRILYAGRSFWLHTYPDIPFRFAEEGHQQPTLLPLHPGMRFHVGQEQIDVLPFEQHL